MKKILFILVMLVFCYAVSYSYAEFEITEKDEIEEINEALQNIPASSVYAIGIGTSKAKHPGEAKRKARDSAILDAYSKLGAIIDGVYLKGKELLIIEDEIKHSKKLKAKVKTIIKGANEALELWVPDKNVYYIIKYIPDFNKNIKSEAELNIEWTEEEKPEFSLSALGIGFSKDEYFTALSFIKARDSAYIDAWAKLKDKLDGAIVKMISEAEFELKKKTIEKTIDGLLKYARVVQEFWNDEDKTYNVEMVLYDEDIEDAFLLSGFKVDFSLQER